MTIFSFLSSPFFLFFFRPVTTKHGEFPCMINACKFLNGKKSELETCEIRHDKVTLNLVKIPSLPFTVRLVYFGLFIFFFGNRIVGYIGVVKCKLLHNGRQKINVHGSPLRFSGFNGERYAGKSIDSLHVRFHHFPFGVKSRSPFKRSINGRAAFCAPTIVLTVC